MVCSEHDFKFVDSRTRRLIAALLIRFDKVATSVKQPSETKMGNNFPFASPFVLFRINRLQMEFSELNFGK